MRKIYCISFAALCLLSACKKDNTENSSNKLINRFVYDGMSNFYLWADEMKDKEAGSGDPVEYFNSLLNNVDKTNGWSYITDDMQALYAEHSGTPKDFGFDITFGINDDAYFAAIKYIYPNSPAANAGLKRRDVIIAIDGEPISQNNFLKLYGQEKITIKLWLYNTTGGYRDIDLTPATVIANPVLYSTIFETGGKKTGYLFYTSFTPNYNGSLFDVFKKFKDSGVTDLVVDLRYNHGGAVSAAIYLASLIAPRSIVEAQSPYTIMDYNDYVNSVFDEGSMSRTDLLGTYNVEDKNPLDANLDLNKVHIIATGDSYSASELTIHCLRPYMDVVHIGDSTGGKYTATWTIHPYSDEYPGVMPLYQSESLTSTEKEQLLPWAMMPVVAVYTNKNNQDFSAAGCLVPDYRMIEGFGSINGWRDIGDPEDVLLGEALYRITGDTQYKPSAKQSIKGKSIQKAGTEMFNINNPKETKTKALWLDNVKIKQF